jgi:hypothetical protein
VLPWTQSTAEQAEVESWFTAGTWLLPSYHQTYWIGYSTNRTWPNFNPIDGTVKKGYANWGTFQVCHSVALVAAGAWQCLLACLQSTPLAPAVSPSMPELLLHRLA